MSDVPVYRGGEVPPHLMTNAELVKSGRCPGDPAHPEAYVLVELFDSQTHPQQPPRVDTPPAYRLEDLRKVHPNSHRRWTEEEEQRLVRRYSEGASITELTAEFGRNENGITARLGRIGLHALRDDLAPPTRTGKDEP